jgi:hypothetical protein
MLLVSSEQKRIYAAMIDNILSESDLSLVTEKKIRNALQERLGYDISGQKVNLAPSGCLLLKLIHF